MLVNPRFYGEWMVLWKEVCLIDGTPWDEDEARQMFERRFEGTQYDLTNSGYHRDAVWTLADTDAE